MTGSIVLALLLATASPQQKPAQELDQIGSLVSALGDKSSFEDLDKLDRYGCAAVPKLVDQLHAVPEKELAPDAHSKHPAAMHIIWSIAALRYITGEEFNGTVAKSDLARYSERARYFLTLSLRPGEAKFFSTWASHGDLYFTPKKTQEQVIAKWRAFSDGGKCKPSTWSGRKDATFWFSGLEP